MTKLGDLIDVIIALFIVSILVYVSYRVLSVVSTPVAVIYALLIIGFAGARLLRRIRKMV